MSSIKQQQKYLTYSVPYLEFDDLVIDFETKWTELYANSDLMLFFELIIHYALHEARLTDARVANYYQLEKVILGAECLIGNDLVWHRQQRVYLILLHY